TGLATIFCVAWFGTRLISRETGWLAAALLGGSWLHVIVAHLNSLDMALAFFLNAAIGAFLVAQHAPVKSSSERRWMLAAWAMAALALLSKGLVGVVLPGLTLLAYSAVARDWSAWRRLHIGTGLLAFLMIGAPWFVAVSIANPGFLEFFFLHEHVQRFLTDVHERTEPWWFFLAITFAGTLPWASLVVPAMLNTWRLDVRTVNATSPSINIHRFLALWIVVIIGFFSFSHSKLAPYILPALPALALLTASYVARASARVVMRHVVGIALLYCFALAYLRFAPLPNRSGVSQAAAATLFRHGAIAFGIALLGAIASVWLVKRRRISYAFITLSAGSFLCLSMLLLVIDGVRGIRSGYDLAAAVAPLHERDKPVYSLHQYDHSLTFYLQRPVTLVDYRGELDFGLTQEPFKGLEDEAAFKHAWASDPAGSLAFLPHDTYERFVDDGVPMVVIGSNLKVKAIKKP
ncbi:MAG: glycosyltransferase family 39 protein, partial [Candidatus Obscuribacterales bacterium]|nr:glycosyltransferase family 39 protein [Steroidobacteraceae bacterium]